jgi:hypothetical protein
MHAATHGWPAEALALLLQHIAARYRLELLLLLARPLLLALQAGNATAAEAMLLVLQQEACTEQPEVLRDVLLLLANQVRRLLIHVWKEGTQVQGACSKCMQLCTICCQASASFALCVVVPGSSQTFSQT